MTTSSTISTGKLLAYGAPIVGAAYLLFFVQFYFLKFAIDVLLLPPVRRRQGGRRFRLFRDSFPVLVMA